MSNPKIQGALIGAMLADLMLAVGITVAPVTLNRPSIWFGWSLAISGAAAGALVGYVYVAVWSKWRAK
ncbi:MAG: hypothetical protein EOR99_35035 [Mesorhizobium sp.]|nr:MAG: hypothetical protein EOR99_35035 [Mesorhizobium sp.]